MQSLLEGKNNFPNHIVEVLNINSNGKDAKRPDSAIFGYLLCLIVFNAFIKADLYFKQETSGPSHDGISVLRIRWCSLSVKMI